MTKSECCGSIGVAWGSPCEECPSSPQRRCPPGYATNDGKNCIGKKCTWRGIFVVMMILYCTSDISIVMMILPCTSDLINELALNLCES